MNEKEMPAVNLENEIIRISNAMQILSASQLKRETIVVLIKDKSQLPKHVIELVLNNLEQLKTTWLKPEKKREIKK